MRPLPLLGALLLAACQGFRPAVTRPPERGPEGKVRVSLGFVRAETTVEARGRFVNGEFRATRLEIEEPDKEVTLKGSLTAFAPPTVVVGGVRLFLPGDAVVVGARAGFRPGAWVKAECRYRRGILRVRKLTLRRRRPGEEEELQGPVDRAQVLRGWIRIGGVRIRFAPNVDVLWDVEGVPAPSWEQRFATPLAQTPGGLRRVRRLDEEDERPAEQLVLWGRVTVGGEVQYELEWRRNHDLLTRKRRDRLLHKPSAKLEISADLARPFFAFAAFKFGRRFVHFDQEKDLDYNTQGDIEELYGLFTDVPFPGLAVQVGRQDFDQGREWVMDDQLDGLRLYVNLRRALLEASVSTKLRDADREEDGVINYLLGLHGEPLPRQVLFLYALHREHGRWVALRRTHLGLSLRGEMGPCTYWLDGAVVRGREGSRRVLGYGFDGAVMYVFEDLPGEPSLVGGVAYGSGDSRPGGKDRSFRQTGLHDNNDRFNGVTSFRYLGELVRPELANLAVYTLGVAVRPFRRTSLDLLFHRYRQVEPAPALRASRLRLSPRGLRADLGYEVDAILGVKAFWPLRIEAVFAYFNPGKAFQRNATDAWFGTLQLEYNF